jgi:hypothetical protein
MVFAETSILLSDAFIYTYTYYYCALFFFFFFFFFFYLPVYRQLNCSSIDLHLSITAKEIHTGRLLAILLDNLYKNLTLFSKVTLAHIFIVSLASEFIVNIVSELENCATTEKARSSSID